MRSTRNIIKRTSIEVVGTAIVRATLDHQEALAMGYLGGAVTAIAALVARGATVTELAASLGALLVAAIALGALHFGRRTLLGAPAAPPFVPPTRRPPRRPSRPPITRRPRRMR